MNGLPLQGRVALVTGAASGIGAAIARRALADGATVHAVDRDPVGLDKLIANAGIVPDEGRALVPHECDLADPVAVKALPAEVDVLVNCAGALHLAPVHELDLELFSQDLRVMVEAPAQLARQTLPHMYERRWGRVVHVGSVHSLVGGPYKAGYVTAKHAIEGLTKVLALEGARHGVTCTTVCPTHVRTPLLERQIEEEAAVHNLDRDTYLSTVLLGGPGAPAVPRIIEPDEVAEVVALLWGPASASISGAPLVMDGAWSAR